MRQQGLGGRLLRIGSLAGGRAEAGRIRFTALALATALLALAFISMVAVHATYQGQERRGLERTPVLHEDASELTAQVLWDVTGDSVEGSMPFPVIYLSPLSADAPLPPGLTQWPARGEAALSPALREQGSDEGIATRYGQATQDITAQGLQSPDELLAYVRPRLALPADEAKAIVGYGPETGPVYYQVGQTEYAKPQWNFQVLPVLLLLLPAGVLLVVAARTGALARDRRTTLIETLGGKRGHRALIVVGEAGLPVLCGAALASAATALFWTVDLRLPWTGHVVVAADMRAWWWAALLAIAFAAVTVLSVTVTTDQLGHARQAGNRPTGTRKPPTRWAILCPVLLLVAVRGPDFFEPGTTPYVMVNWAGAAGALATLPAAIAIVMAFAGRLIARAGRRSGSSGLIIAGCRAAAHPGPVARMTAGVAVALGLLLQVVAWQGQFGEAAQQARSTIERIGQSALVVRPGPGSTNEQLRAFEAAVAPDALSVAFHAPPEENTLTIEGTCPALNALSLSCSTSPSPLNGPPQDPRLVELLGWYGGTEGRVSVRVGDPVSQTVTDDAFTSTVLVSPEGDDLSVGDIKQLAYRSFPMGADVATAGGEWLSGSQVNEQQGRWLTFFGFLGITTLAFAAGTTGMAEFLRAGRALAPLSALSGNRRVYWTASAVSILLPLALAGALGCLVGVWLAFPKTADGGSHISDLFLVACLASVAAIAVLAWAYASKVSLRQAALWRPRGE
ncbi:ABC transporter permease [Streptomyces sp. JJ66]|uniref:ABC transporter permease n=1 Tax=Streptomyces sp. JJ66 TaxID=2803843 RepID=UPI001C572AF9|nr:ABC transporter permease [Streptomyces sp. JJ66]MBW1602625.1 ABC transporter permease [Streptomyces sp. JJ66]